MSTTAASHKAIAAPMGGAKPTTPTPTPTPTPTAVETPEQKFRRLCVPRVEKSLNDLRRLKNLARLKPSNDHCDKVIAALTESLKDLEAVWRRGTKDTNVFSL